MKDGYYFVIKLTESEHSFVSYELDDYCKDNGLVMKYYRKLKTGHVPMLREVKIIGNRCKIAKLKTYMENNLISNCIENEYWQERKNAEKFFIKKYGKEGFDNLLKN